MVTPKVGAKRVDARKASTRPARMLSVVSISPAGNRERSMPGRRLLGLGSAALYIDRRDPCKIEIPAGGRIEICDMHQAHPYRAVME